MKNVLEERRRMLVMELCPRQCLWISVEGLCGPGEGSCGDMPPRSKSTRLNSSHTVVSRMPSSA